MHRKNESEFKETRWPTGPLCDPGPPGPKDPSRMLNDVKEAIFLSQSIKWRLESPRPEQDFCEETLESIHKILWKYIALIMEPFK